MKILILCLFLLGLNNSDVIAQNKFGVGIQFGNAMHDPRNIYDNFIPVNTADNSTQQMHKHYLGLKLSYALTDSLSLRLRTGWTHFNMHKKLDYFGSGFHYLSKYSGVQFNIHIAPGIVWNIGSSKLKLQVGFELLYTQFGKYDYEEDAVTNDSITEQTVVHRITTTNIPGGFGIGLGGIMGFQYQPLKWLAFGAEFIPTIMYVILEGKRVDETIYTVTSAPSQTDSRNEIFHGLNSTEYVNRFAINVSFWF